MPKPRLLIVLAAFVALAVVGTFLSVRMVESMNVDQLAEVSDDFAFEEDTLGEGIEDIEEDLDIDSESGFEESDGDEVTGGTEGDTGMHDTGTGDPDKAAEELWHDAQPTSRDMMVQMMQHDGYSQAESEEAVDNLPVDWREQAALYVQSYLDTDSLSRAEIIDMLEIEGFTSDEIEFAMVQLGV